MARATWRVVVPALDEAGILAAVDGMILADLCVIRARLDEAERTLSREGTTTADGRRHPAAVVANQLRGRFDRLTVQLGLSPTARLRMTGTPAGVPTGGVEQDESYPFDV